jgi:hypothetical protein
VLYFSKNNWNKLVELRLCYFVISLVRNVIGSKGCKYLSKTAMPLLTSIDLGEQFNYSGSNNIDSCGVLHLSKTKWDKLEKAYLRMLKMMKTAIKSKQKGFNTA